MQSPTLSCLYENIFDRDRSLRVLSFGKLFQEPVCQTLTIPENRLQGPYSKGCTLIADAFMPFVFLGTPGWAVSGVTWVACVP
jgi:hypothetical protein